MDTTRRPLGQLKFLSHVHFYLDSKIHRAVISSYGQIRPIIINPQNYVIDGWALRNAMREMNYSEAECLVYDLNEDQSRLLRLQINLPKNDDDLLYIAKEVKGLVEGDFFNFKKVLMNLPYEEKEMRDLINLLDYDYSKLDTVEVDSSQISMF